MDIPPRPDRFDPEIPPPGFELKLISFWRDRPKINPRLQLVHTNAAAHEGDIESAYNWANQPGSGHTIPHCQIDRSGRGALMLPSNRKGIANYLAAPFSLGFETADTGYLDDPLISAFTEKQAESVAIACAYYSVLHDIPLEYPKAWDGSGTACHTEPFGYPLWTNSLGKSCPGPRKKTQVRDIVLPRALEIVAAWTAPTPEPTPEPPPEPPPPTTPTTSEEPMIVAKTTDGAHYASFGLGTGALPIGTTPEHRLTVEAAFASGVALDASAGYPLKRVALANWAAVPSTRTKAQAFEILGDPVS